MLRMRSESSKEILVFALISIALGGPVHAEVIHGYFLWSGSTTDSVDVDGDGQSDFSIYNNTQDCPSGCRTTIGGGNGAGVAVAPDGNVAAGFTHGNLIGPNLEWAGSGALALIDAGGCYSGVFCDSSASFLALRLGDDTGDRYGWLRVRSPLGQLYDFAFETEPGVPIAAGAGYRCAGDIDEDLDVDLADLAILLSNFGRANDAEFSHGDLDGDGQVDVSDLTVTLASFGASCGMCDWNDVTWVRENPPTHPSSDYGHALTYDSLRGVTVLFGGQTHGLALAETWEWNGLNWTQRQPSISPPPTAGAAMVYDSRRGVSVVFDGRGPEVWEWNGDFWQQRDAKTGPSARYGAAMAYDSRRGVTVLFGGLGDDAESDDTWEWDGSVWTRQETAIRPPGRFGHAMAYDSVRGVTVLFGGGIGWGCAGDLWEWDGAEWVQRLSLAGRAGHSLVFDSARGVTVLFGGSCWGQSWFQTWEWDGVSWARNPRPLDAWSGALAHDSQRHATVLFGYGATLELAPCSP